MNPGIDTSRLPETADRIHNANYMYRDVFFTKIYYVTRILTLLNVVWSLIVNFKRKK